MCRDHSDTTLLNYFFNIFCVACADFVSKDISIVLLTWKCQVILTFDVRRTHVAATSCLLRCPVLDVNYDTLLVTEFLS